MTAYIETNDTEQGIPLNTVQQEFAEKKGLLPSGVKILPAPVFKPNYSLSNKETDEDNTLPDGLSHLEITYVKKHNDEYVYAEEPVFSTVGVDGISLEEDDVFGTITALFGLQIQKKHGEWLKTYIDTTLGTAPGTRSLMFSGEDGMWDVNIAINYLEGFSDGLTFDETLQLLYIWIFNMLVALEEQA